MSEVYSGFKFAIGDHLLHKKPDGWKPIKPLWSSKRDGDGRMRMFVVERIYQECHGGVQLNYGCRVVHGDGAFSTDLVRFNEVEVETWTPVETECE